MSEELPGLKLKRLKRNEVINSEKEGADGFQLSAHVEASSHSARDSVMPLPPYIIVTRRPVYSYPQALRK